VLAAGKDIGHLGHDIGHQKQHDCDRDHRHDRRIERGADQPRLEGLAFLQVVGQPLQHQAQVAALLAGVDHRDVDLGELARMLRQRLGERGAGVHLGPQCRHQVALLFLLGFLRQRRQGAFQWQAGADQAGDLPGPDRQAGGVEHRPAEQAHAQAKVAFVGRCAGTDRRHLQRHQRLGSQLTARRLGGVGFQHALEGVTLGVEGFERIRGHAAIIRIRPASLCRARRLRPGAGGSAAACRSPCAAGWRRIRSRAGT
jgi:hypothetical protein